MMTASVWATLSERKSGDLQMVPWATHMKSLDTDVMFTFNHEPEILENTPNGDSRDYIDAWRRFHEVFEAEGVDNVQWAWIMTAWSFHVPESDRRAAARWFPGDDVVDVLGVDAYNWSSCHPNAGTKWRPLTAVVQRFRQFADLHPEQDLLISDRLLARCSERDAGHRRRRHVRRRRLTAAARTRREIAAWGGDDLSTAS